MKSSIYILLIFTIFIIQCNTRKNSNFEQKRIHEILKSEKYVIPFGLNAAFHYYKKDTLFVSISSKLEYEHPNRIDAFCYGFIHELSKSKLFYNNIFVNYKNKNEHFQSFYDKEGINKILSDYKNKRISNFISYMINDISPSEIKSINTTLKGYWKHFDIKKVEVDIFDLMILYLNSCSNNSNDDYKKILLSLQSALKKMQNKFNIHDEFEHIMYFMDLCNTPVPTYQ